MTYSYTQISHYLTCPRRYRHRYLDGWQEKATRAAMLFGRAFELALAAYFLREDPAAVLFREWAACQNQGLRYSNGDTWDRMLQQGVQLLERFCQDDRVRIRQPRRNLQVKFTRAVSQENDFVAYVDAIGRLDGTRCLLEWKTTSSRYPEEPDGLLALDPQLVCYSWITGIAEVAQVVFVRKRLVEVQYLHTTITGEQRQEFGQLVEDTIRRIESAQFLPHSGTRFPQNTSRPPGINNLPIFNMAKMAEEGQSHSFLARFSTHLPPELACHPTNRLGSTTRPMSRRFSLGSPGSHTLQCAIATALSVSMPYAADIRAGRRRPHPRHWQALARLVGIYS